LLPQEAVKALQLRAGDSASVLLRGARIPARNPGSQRLSTDTAWIGVEVSLLRVRSQAESRRMAWERLMARDARDEERILATFLEQSKDEWSERMGIRYAGITGSGTPIASGQQVTLHYRARFLDTGRVFDDTWKGGQPLTFKLGDPGQVIKGLEIALHLLPDGGRGRFIIPSALAFGPQGSSGGIVPPFTPLLYEVEARVVPAPPAS
jgi:FKBP-type peptidyl-prolyl cis-trans isomerase